MNSCKITLLLCFFTFILTSCYTPQAVIRIQPNSNEKVFWYQGQAIAEAKKDSIVARAAFSHLNDHFYVFDVEVFNEKEKPVLVTPEMMAIYTSSEFRIPATDPEKLILYGEIEAAQDEARRKNNGIVAGVVLVGAAVAIAVSAGDDDNEYESYDDDNDYDGESDLVRTTDAILPLVSLGLEFHNQRILSTNVDDLPTTNDSEFWTDIALRKTTLRKGESIRGLVAFPIYKSENLSLNILIDGTEFEFSFNRKDY